MSERSSREKRARRNVVSIDGLNKTYHLDSVAVAGLDEVTLRIRANRFTVLSGPSGSGKTSLLNMIGCVDRPDSGRIRIGATDVGELDDDALSDFRSRYIGYIFQTFNLIPVLTAFENVEYPLRLRDMTASERRVRVMDMLDAVGLADKARHRPGQLSGGQRQRVAIARALAPRPRLVLADEPTANLDSRTGEAIIKLMRRMQREHAASFIFSSHDPRVLQVADSVIQIHDGRIVAPAAARPAATTTTTTTPMPLSSPSSSSSSSARAFPSAPAMKPPDERFGLYVVGDVVDLPIESAVSDAGLEAHATRHARPFAAGRRP